ncbi:hypothetical protein POM88_016605 [Heracleum sosnowskyi]|uniref:Uncharacterized protein n=1 Tax=Heracleum sosnowskyi TaxID=360622 RepID=A0AAD8MXK4_9APIA|nr:hypothetical protein POM88_016605 [Heracleum sosnowskyi]
MQVERCFQGAGQKEKRLLAKGGLSRPGGENKVVNECVTRGNLPNSSGQILKKAKMCYLMSLRSISETEESGISCVGVKSRDLRRNAKSEGSSLGPYRCWGAKAWGENGIRYPGDVELTAEKDSAFRRAARWCGLQVIYWRKVGMTSSLRGPYGLGHTRATMANTMGSKAVRRSESGKIAAVRIALCNSRT